MVAPESGAHAPISGAIEEISREDAQSPKLRQDIDAITGDILDAALKLRTKLGQGLLESVYELVLTRELEHRGYV